MRPLHTLIIGGTFPSLGGMSLQGKGITKLEFMAESPITTTGVFVLFVDSALVGPVELPDWVVQTGPWSVQAAALAYFPEPETSSNTQVYQNGQPVY
jgi:hypothetical protein